MEFAVLGTGMVGRTLGTKLIRLGHQVTMGSRTTANETAAAWAAESGPAGRQGTFAEAAAAADMIINATSGDGSLSALATCDPQSLAGRVLIDVANPLDFSRGMPPRLSLVNDTSLGEEIQRALPGTRVVKALNTMSCAVMVDPGSVPPPHEVFLCGNDAMAKAEVSALLEDFGWPSGSLTDLGDITAARGMEMVLPLWIRLSVTQGAGPFNFHLAR